LNETSAYRCKFVVKDTHTDFNYIYINSTFSITYSSIKLQCKFIFNYMNLLTSGFYILYKAALYI